jgi:hypothetical protein
MAEIKIERKKPIWPWILLVIIIIAAVVFFVMNNDETFDREIDDVEVIDDPDGTGMNIEEKNDKSLSCAGENYWLGLNGASEDSWSTPGVS